MKWHRLCESRLRLLMSALDNGPEVCIYPFAQFMKRNVSPEISSDTSSQSSNEEYAQEALLFIGLRFSADVESLNLKAYASEFLYGHLNSWEGRKPGMDFMMAHVVQEDLPLDLIEQHVKIKSATSPGSLSSSSTTDDESSSELDKSSSLGVDSEHGSDDDISAMMPSLKRQRSGTIDKTPSISKDE